MRSSRWIYDLASLLFALTALVTALGHTHDWAASAVWIALSAVFLALGMQSRLRS